MKKILQSDRGFTLMEVIISIATLALISVFILNMFIVSEGVNRRAKNVDVAANLAVGAIELYKQERGTREFFQSSFFNDATVTGTSDVTWEAYRYYDKEWRPLATVADPNEIDELLTAADNTSRVAELPGNVRFVMTVQSAIAMVSETKRYQGFEAGVLPEPVNPGEIGEIIVTIHDVQTKSANKRILADLKAKQYFDGR